MKMLLTGCLAFGLMTAASVPVHANALSLLSMDGIVDTLEDDDFESLVTNVNNNALDPGEASVLDNFSAFVGVIQVPGYNAGDGVPVFSAVFAAKIVGFTASLDGAPFGRYTFGALDSDEWDSLRDNMYASLPTRGSDASAVLVYSDTNIPFDLSGSEDLAIQTASDGTPLFEFGFVGDNLYAQFDLFSETTGAFRLALNATVDGGLEFHELTAAAYAAADINAPKKLGVGADFLGATDLHVDGNIASGDTISHPFDYQTSSKMWVNATPEPGGFTLVAIFGVVAGAVRYRRTRTAKHV